MSNRVELLRKTEANGISIEALVTDEGDLLLVGREDPAPEDTLAGAHGQEYWLRVPSEAKDDALLALLENFFSGNAAAISDIRALLIATGVPCELFSH
jgi:hypothetical protein